MTYGTQLKLIHVGFFFHHFFTSVPWTFSPIFFLIPFAQQVFCAQRASFESINCTRNLNPVVLYFPPPTSSRCLPPVQRSVDSGQRLFPFSEICLKGSTRLTCSGGVAHFIHLKTENVTHLESNFLCSPIPPSPTIPPPTLWRQGLKWSCQPVCQILRRSRMCVILHWAPSSDYLVPISPPLI